MTLKRQPAGLLNDARWLIANAGRGPPDDDELSADSGLWCPPDHQLVEVVKNAVFGNENRRGELPVLKRRLCRHYA